MQILYAKCMQSAYMENRKCLITRKFKKYHWGLPNDCLLTSASLVFSLLAPLVVPLTAP